MIVRDHRRDNLFDLVYSIAVFDNGTNGHDHKPFDENAVQNRRYQRLERALNKPREGASQLHGPVIAMQEQIATFEPAQDDLSTCPYRCICVEDVVVGLHLCAIHMNFASDHSIGSLNKSLEKIDWPGCRCLGIALWFGGFELALAGRPQIAVATHNPAMRRMLSQF
jgi:hypothetical protein